MIQDANSVGDVITKEHCFKLRAVDPKLKDIRTYYFVADSETERYGHVLRHCLMHSLIC
jgi:hypothetical protein